jgi:hypothetical protein
MIFGVAKTVVPAISLVANKVLRPTCIAASSSSMLRLPSMTTILTPPVSLFLRGGGQSTLDLTRVSMRLDGFNSYAIIAALLLNATLKLYCMTPKQIESGGNISKEKVASILFLLFAGTSLLCTAYSTLVFSLLSLYSKTALGLGQDAAFLEFFAATAVVRKRAFHSLLAALLSFKLCFTASLFIHYDGKMRWWLVSIATIVGILSWMHWQSVISIAGDLLFRR